MKQKLIISAATSFELNLLQSKLKSTKDIDIFFEVTGVGMLATCFNLCQIIHHHHPNYILQIGIAGLFDKTEKLGQSFIVKKEYLTDLGVYENNQWNDLFDMNFVSANDKPFHKKGIINGYTKKFDIGQLSKVNATTVNQISVDENIIQQIQKKYKPTIESMEGAALHYVCNMNKIPYLQIRAASNYVGERDKTKWKIQKAIESITKETIAIVKNSF